MSLDALAAVPLPLRALGVEIEATASDYMERSRRALGERLVVPRVPEQRFLAQFSLLDLGGVVVNAARVSPLISRHEPNGDAVMVLTYGGHCSYRHGISRRDSAAGEGLLTLNDGGAYECGIFSGLVLAVECSVLERTAADLVDASGSLAIASMTALSAAESSTLFSFFAHIDQLVQQDRWLPGALGLGSQFYRYLAITLLRQCGQIDRLRHRQQGRRGWSSGLDELVDHIRCNRHRPFTTADLERLSHYSARHLSTLFRERFHCTPMQFVRRQRLELAMERLSAPHPGDTVIRIARLCGYHHAANFSVDFQRQFGSRPSDVLRLSRRAKALSL